MPRDTPIELTAFGRPASCGAKCSRTYIVLSENSGPSAAPSRARSAVSVSAPSAYGESSVISDHRVTLMTRPRRTPSDVS